MRFSVGATQAIQTRIALKSRNYSIMGDQRYFQHRNDVLRQTIGTNETSCLLYEFHERLCGGHFAG
jgi:hypothetical protein